MFHYEARAQRSSVVGFRCLIRNQHKRLFRRYSFGKDSWGIFFVEIGTSRELSIFQQYWQCCIAAKRMIRDVPAIRRFYKIMSQCVPGVLLATNLELLSGGMFMPGNPSIYSATRLEQLE